MAQLTEKQFVDRLVKWVAIGDGSVWPAADECMDRLEWSCAMAIPCAPGMWRLRCGGLPASCSKTTGKKRIPSCARHQGGVHGRGTLLPPTDGKSGVK